MIHYKKLLPIVETIPYDKVKKPKMPVAIFLQEVSDLIIWIKHDREALLKVGLSATLLDDLEPRMEALEDAESNWNHFKNSESEKEKAFKAKKKDAIALRRELLHSFRYAFRDRDDLIRGIRRSAAGNSLADLIQDLMDLSVIGDSQRELLGKIHFDMELLKRSADLCFEFRQKAGAYNAEEGTRLKLLGLRNRFYTYLYQAVSAIREGGRYAFRNDPNRAKGYSSSYFRNHNSKKSHPLL